MWKEYREGIEGSMGVPANGWVQPVAYDRENNVWIYEENAAARLRDEN